MEKKLKTLEEHDSEYFKDYWNLNSNEPIPNGIACPDCGKELYDSQPMITLASYPPKKNITCKNCNYNGYRIA